MAAAGAVALNPAPARTGSGAPGIGPIPACALDLAGRDDRLVRGVGRARVANPRFRIKKSEVGVGPV